MGAPDDHEEAGRELAGREEVAREQPERLAGYLQRLQEVSAALAATSTDHEIAEALMDVVLPALGAEGGVFGVIEGGDLRVVRFEGYGDALKDLGALVPLDVGLPFTEAARTGELVTVSSAEERQRRFPTSSHVPVLHQSLVAVPILMAGVPHGVLGLTFARAQAFAASDRVFLLTVAQQCGLALERCRLLTAERARLVRAQDEAGLLEALGAAGAALAGELDVQQIIETVVATATDLAGARFGAYFAPPIGAAGAGESGGPYASGPVEASDESDVSDVSGESGESGAPEGSDEFPVARCDPAGERPIDLLAPAVVALVGLGMEGAGPVRVDDARTDGRLPLADDAGRGGQGGVEARSAMVVPVASADGTLHGAIWLGHPDPDRFTDRSERLAVGVAAHAAVALDNARQYEEQQRARLAAEDVAERLGRLQALTSALSGASTVDQVLVAMTQLVARDLVSPGRVWLLDEQAGMLRLPANARFGGFEGQPLVIPVDADVPVAVAVRTRSPVFVEDSATLRYAESFAAVPLLVDGRPIGVLSLGFNRPRRFHDADRRFFVAMGEQCAAALDRARLYEGEHLARARAEADRSRAQHMSTALQTSLLPPKLPLIPGVELDARYHAAMEGMDIGGDFYDVFDTGDGWALVLGDVVGKGPEAAALTALVRYTIRSVTMDIREPARILRRLNDTMLLHEHDERFCTVAYGRVVPEPGAVRVSVCLGGHLPPLVLRATGEVEEAGVPGGLIGLFADIELRDETVVLGPGDAIVFFTDGVTEAARGGEEFGSRGVTQVLQASAGRPASELSRRIEDEVLAFGGPEPRDDLAILVLRVLV